MHPAFVKNARDAVPIWFAGRRDAASVLGKLDAGARAFAKAAGFEGRPGEYLLLPGNERHTGRRPVRPGQPARAAGRPVPAGRLADLLPAGTYRFANAPHEPRLAALAFALGAYKFAPLSQGQGRRGEAACCRTASTARNCRAIVEAVALARDLINTPSNDMGPAELEAAARKLAKQHRAKFAVTSGAKLAKEFPLVQAVGGGSARAPRLIDFTWGNPKHPKVTLVGKGVCFDTGGLDIKTDAGMLNMKKDMGGAATALALAHMLMSRRRQDAAARHHSGGGEFDLGHQLSPARRLSLPQGHHASRSAIPTPKAA